MGAKEYSFPVEKALVRCGKAFHCAAQMLKNVQGARRVKALARWLAVHEGTCACGGARARACFSHHSMCLQAATLCERPPAAPSVARDSARSWVCWTMA